MDDFRKHHEIMFVYTILVIILSSIIIHFAGVNRNDIVVNLALTLVCASAIIHTVFTWIEE